MINKIFDAGASPIHNETMEQQLKIHLLNRELLEADITNKNKSLELLNEQIETLRKQLIHSYNSN